MSEAKYANIEKVLATSAKLKARLGWTRAIGAGFISEDIANLEIRGPILVVNWLPVDGRGPSFFPVVELNLRETEEALAFAARKVLQGQGKNP